MLVSYPALFYYDAAETEKYSIFFADLSGGTVGKTVNDAMAMASDYLGGVLAILVDAGHNMPKPSDITKLDLVKNDPFKDDADFTPTYDLSKSFLSMVSVDLTNYLGAEKPVKKTLTIPKWADTLGKRKNINFSEVLTDAILRLDQ